MVELFIQFSDQGFLENIYKINNPSYEFNLNDPGSCSWDIALSQLTIDGFSLTADEFAPKRIDYNLLGSTDGGSSFTKLQSGRILDVGLESDTGVINCSGADWLEYLNQPFPLDYSLTPATLTDNVAKAFRGYVSAAGTDTANIKYNSTQQSVIDDILDAANGLSDIVYSAVYTGAGWTSVLDYSIMYLDGTTMLDHIKAIGSLKDPFGFDFWCDWDGSIHFYSPALVANPSSVVTVLDLVYGQEGIVKVKWHNAGPKATRTVAFNNASVWKQSIYTPSITTFRDYLELVQLGEHFNFGTSYTNIQSIVNSGADAQGTLDRNPQKDLTLTILPNLIFTGSEIAGFQSMVGQAISFNSGTEFLPYHTINADYFIVSQSFRSDDDSGNYVCDLGLQQIYTT